MSSANKKSDTEEDKIKVWIKAKLESEGYRLRREPPVIGTVESKEMALDFYAFKDGNPPDVIWVECKGDVDLSMLIEGFARIEFATFMGGGRGLFVAPRKQIDQMLRYKEFFDQVPHILIVAAQL